MKPPIIQGLLVLLSLIAKPANETRIKPSRFQTSNTETSLMPLRELLAGLNSMDAQTIAAHLTDAQKEQTQTPYTITTNDTTTSFHHNRYSSTSTNESCTYTKLVDPLIELHSNQPHITRCPPCVKPTGSIHTDKHISIYFSLPPAMTNALLKLDIEESITNEACSYRSKNDSSTVAIGMAYVNGPKNTIRYATVNKGVSRITNTAILTQHRTRECTTNLSQRSPSP